MKNTLKVNPKQVAAAARRFADTGEIDAGRAAKLVKRLERFKRTDVPAETIMTTIKGTLELDEAGILLKLHGLLEADKLERGGIIAGLASKSSHDRYMAHKLLKEAGDRTGLVDDLRLPEDKREEVKAMLGPRLHPKVEAIVNEHSPESAYYIVGLIALHPLEEVMELVEKVDVGDRETFIEGLWKYRSKEHSLDGMKEALEHYGGLDGNLFVVASLFEAKLNAVKMSYPEEIDGHFRLFQISSENIKRVETVTDLSNAHMAFYHSEHGLDTVLKFLENKARELHAAALKLVGTVGMTEVDNVVKKFATPLPVLIGLANAKTNFMSREKGDWEFDRISAVLEVLEDNEKGRALDVLSNKGYDTFMRLERYAGVYRRLAVYALETSKEMDEVVKLSPQEAEMLLGMITGMVHSKESSDNNLTTRSMNAEIERCFDLPKVSLRIAKAKEVSAMGTYRELLGNLGVDRIPVFPMKPHELEAAISFFGELLSENEGKTKKLSAAKKAIASGGTVSMEDLLSIATTIKGYSKGLEEVLEKDRYVKDDLIKFKQMFEKQDCVRKLRVKLFNAYVHRARPEFDPDRVNAVQIQLYLGTQDLAACLDRGKLGDLEAFSEHMTGRYNEDSSAFGGLGLNFAYVRLYVQGKKGLVANPQRNLKNLPSRIRKATEDLGAVLLLEAESEARKMGLKEIVIPAPRELADLWNIGLHPRTAIEFYVRAPRKLGYELVEVGPGYFGLQSAEGIDPIMVWKKDISKPSGLVKVYDEIKSTS
ncbi:MAG: hypothetical protein ABIG39_01055 [Candidatus Micrarchaeota archaeon]